MTDVYEPVKTDDGATDQVKDKAQQVTGEAKSRVASEVDTRSTQAGEQLRSTALDVRSVAGHLRDEGKDRPAELMDKAAERVERFGDYLHDSDGSRLLRDVEEFGRSKPWAVIAGGVALGFAASRFLKASSSRRYEQSRAAYRPPTAVPQPLPPQAF